MVLVLALRSCSLNVESGFYKNVLKNFYYVFFLKEKEKVYRKVFSQRFYSEVFFFCIVGTASVSNLGIIGEARYGR